ncbi:MULTISPECIES: aminopeptidase P family protein [unclassified Mycoplasma]|uniref:aminopeptidase P family protein n=1 Tax=unclassified Mycoplasma TaxID=2683645 RepID=UPI00216AFC38|nr:MULTISPECIES: aminopeptidase P family protein [unclassified Mycoplasma]MCS4536971.1 aminopeptidase P family protein [Mycoplasma sp. CSL7475-4]MCT4469501.1 aminopeptidase P family protein [Mycoplasma sp. HS2188]
MNRKYLEKMFAEHKVDALVSEAQQTRLWLTGIQTTDGYVIIEKDEAHLFVDGRYIEYARNNAKNVTVHLLAGTSMKEFFEEKKYNRVAFEKDYLKIETWQYLQKLIKPKEEVFISGQELRILKSEEEIKIMQASIDISLKSLEQLKQWIKPGFTEKEVAAKLNYLMKLNGAEKESFDEIVASGPSSAEPHHHPTDRKLVAGDLLKIDFGALYKGYSADITRTFILSNDGAEVQANNPKAQEILDIVLAAAKAGRDAVRPGIKASEIDKICRDYIEKAGYGQYFVHGTGHGLGIDVHELPYVSSKAKDYTLEPGMVITVEPGIYIEGLGGARNEDDVLVTETGRYVFSRPEERS